jgi:hypothetical protein
MTWKGQVGWVDVFAGWDHAAIMSANLRGSP